MRKLIASDVFAALRVVSAIEKKQDIETTIKDLVKNAENETKADGDDKTAKERNDDFIVRVGVSGVFKIIEIATEARVEGRVYEFLAGPFEMPPADVQNMPLPDFVENVTRLTNLDCKSLKIQGKTTEEIAAGKASEAETAAKKAAADELNAYKEAVTKDLADMQGQIDGQIETWFFDDEPSPTTPPASDWTTDELKENHAGDLYYSGKGYAYRWTHSGGAWTWLQIKDTDITAALQNAKRAQETANSKRRTFLVQPTPPYDIGDLWDGALKALVCIMAVDYITGVVCALIWHKSPKSADGTFESKASIKGLFRKGAILLVVLVAYKVDLLAGTAGVTRTAVILFFCANDGMSIVENLGIMGVPMPPALKDAFAVLRQKSGDEESAADETE